jgi:hypothetical protein
MNAPAGQPGGTLSQLASNVGRSGLAALSPYERDIAAINTMKRQLSQMDAQGISADNKNRQALAGDLFKLQAQVDMKNATLAQARAVQGGTDIQRARIEREDAQTAYNQLLNKARSDLQQAASKMGSDAYKRFKGNPSLLNQEAEEYAYKNLNPVYREILKLRADLPPVVPGVSENPASTNRPPLSSFQQKT